MNKLKHILENLDTDASNLTEIRNPKVLLTEEKIVDKILDIGYYRNLIYSKRSYENRGTVYIAWSGGDSFEIGFKFTLEEDIHWLSKHSLKEAIQEFNKLAKN